MSVYQYKAFGLPITSSVELPALLQVPSKGDGSSSDSSTSVATSDQWYPGDGGAPNVPIEVNIRTISEDEYKHEGHLFKKPFSRFNERVFFYEIPDVGRYLVKGGNEIQIEPLSEDWNHILLYFYSNCLSAALYQRGIIPIHASGVLDEQGDLWLISAPSRVGKSTTALMLHSLGYRLFTDDTLTLSFHGGECRAWASYPMARVWPKSVQVQERFNKEDFFEIRPNLDKSGAYFHSDFHSGSVKIAGVMFLKSEGDEIRIERLSRVRSLELLGFNLYRRQWIYGMKKQLLQFQLLSAIAKTVPAWSVIRPKNEPTFKELAQAIDQQVIRAEGLSSVSGRTA